VIKTIIQNGNRPSNHVIFDKDPERLVQRVIQMIVEKRDESTRRAMGWD
jgi:hypothetical protein